MIEHRRLSFAALAIFGIGCTSNNPPVEQVVSKNPIPEMETEKSKETVDTTPIVYSSPTPFPVSARQTKIDIPELKPTIEPRRSPTPSPTVEEEKMLKEPKILWARELFLPPNSDFTWDLLRPGHKNFIAYTPGGYVVLLDILTGQEILREEKIKGKLLREDQDSHYFLTPEKRLVIVNKNNRNIALVTEPLQNFEWINETKPVLLLALKDPKTGFSNISVALDANGRPIWSEKGHVAYSSKEIVSLISDDTLKGVSPITGSKIWELDYSTRSWPDGPIFYGTFTQKGNKFAAGVDLKTGKTLWKFEHDGDNSMVQTLGDNVYYNWGNNDNYILTVFDKHAGKKVWEQKSDSYTSVGDIGGSVIVMEGNNGTATSRNPKTGVINWKASNIRATYISSLFKNTLVLQDHFFKTSPNSEERISRHFGLDFKTGKKMWELDTEPEGNRYFLNGRFVYPSGQKLRFANTETGKTYYDLGLKSEKLIFVWGLHDLLELITITSDKRYFLKVIQVG